LINIGNDGSVSIYKQLEVKKEKDIEDEEIEISLKEAKKIRKDAKE